MHLRKFVLAATAAVAILLCGTNPAQAAPTYQELSAEALVSVLPSGAEAPMWLGTPTSTNIQSFTPSQGIPICYLGNGDEVLGKQAQLGAVSAVDYGPYPSGGFLNTISRIYQYPDASSASDAWRNLQKNSSTCVSKIRTPWQYSDTPVLGTRKGAITVHRGEGQFGQRSVVIDGQNYSIPTGSSTPTMTSRGMTIWRHVGNVLYEVIVNKVVSGNVASALSSSDIATANALSLLIGERYNAAAR